MAYTTIDNGEEHFNTVLYTGDGSADNDITGVGFAPDWVWAKNRGAADAHWVLDSTRGATKGLYTNGTAAENTQNHLISFDSDGFSVGNQANGLNTSSNNYVAWNWKANGGTTSSNTDGSITSTVQANTTAGFSIVTYTGSGSAGSFGHGLTSPKIIIIKDRDDSNSWYFHTTAIDGSDDYVFLDQTTAKSNASAGYSIGTSVYNMGGAGSVTNLSGTDYVAYCFQEIKGYSKFSSYTGNGNADGAFVYTGFRPAFVIGKKTSGADNWYLMDTKRLPFNSSDGDRVFPNLSNAESTDGPRIDFVSNGFKIKTAAGLFNDSGATYIYMAFAEHPFVSSKGVPVTAR